MDRSSWNLLIFSHFYRGVHPGGGGAVSKKFVRLFGPQFGLKIRGARPVDPPLPGVV